jgi:anti-sigma B factor antagonist
MSAVRCATTPPCSECASSDGDGVSEAYDHMMSGGHLINVETSERDSALVVVVAGELDMASVPELAKSIEEIDWDRYDRVIFDLHGVSFMDSSGLGALIAMHNEHPDTDIALVTADQGLVTKVLELTSMKDLFPIYSSAEAALA